MFYALRYNTFPEGFTSIGLFSMIMHKYGEELAQSQTIKYTHVLLLCLASKTLSIGTYFSGVSDVKNPIQSLYKHSVTSIVMVVRVSLAQTLKKLPAFCKSLRYLQSRQSNSIRIHCRINTFVGSVPLPQPSCYV